MSNNNDISVQTTSSSFTLQHPDGSEVTPQEVYDAFMSGLVMLFDVNYGVYYSPIFFVWEDVNGGNDDPTNVVAVGIKYFNFNETITDISIGAGASS